MPFGGRSHGWHDGRVRSRADDKTRERYVVVYDDGDEVTLTRAQVEQYSVAETPVKAEIAPPHMISITPPSLCRVRVTLPPGEDGLWSPRERAATAATSPMPAGTDVSATAPAPRADAVLANKFCVRYDGWEDEDPTRVDTQKSEWRLALPTPAAAARHQPEPAAAGTVGTAAAAALG